MKHTAFVLTVALTLGGAAALAAPAIARADDGEKETVEQRVRRLVGELGADDPTVREKAHEELKKIGEPAVAALEKAVDSPDAEVRWRAKDILSAVRGARPTPNEQPRTRARGPDGTEDPNDPMQGFGQGFEELQKMLEGMGGGGEMKEALEEMRKLFGGLIPNPNEEPKDEDEDGAESKTRSRVRIFRAGPGGQWELEEMLGGSGKGTLGMEVRRVPASLRAHLDLPLGAGVLVNRVDKGGRAAEIGLEQYDVIYGVGDEVVRSPKDLDALAKNEDDLEVKLIRKGKPMAITAPGAAEKKAEPAPAPAPEEKGSEDKRRNY